MQHSHNGNLEQLIEQITDAIVARLNGEGSDQAKLCGCTSECFNRCPERMHRVVDAGAARIGLVLGVDRFLDMCRTTLNVTGDLAAAVVVSRGEGSGAEQAEQPVDQPTIRRPEQA